MPSMILVTLVSCLALAKKTNASGNTFFPYSNPLASNPLYYPDTTSILNDLGSFSALSIRYHNCAWSPWGTVNAFYENNDDDDGYEREATVCPNDVDGGDSKWYMNFDACRRANVAYSLYGTLSSGGKTGCSKHTYINSFFTKDGLASFGDVIINTGVNSNFSTNGTTSDGIAIDASPYCYEYSFSDTDQEYSDDNIDEVENDGNKRRRLSKNDEKSEDDEGRSVTTGCSSSGGFTIDGFKGTSCEGTKYVRTLANLDYLNEQLEEVSCVQIYTSSVDYASDLLANSRPCDGGDYGDYCPDPFGMLEHNVESLNAALYQYYYPPLGDDKMLTLKNQVIAGGFLFGTLVLLILKFLQPDYKKVHREQLERLRIMEEEFERKREEREAARANQNDDEEMECEESQSSSTLSETWRQSKLDCLTRESDEGPYPSGHVSF